MRSIRRLAGVLGLAVFIGLLLCTVPAEAQTQPKTLTTLNAERTIALSGVLTTATPDLPANVLAAVASGALEIREQLNYNAQQNLLTSTYFTVAPGSPSPTNLVQINFGSILASVTLTPDKIYFGTTPGLSVMMVGTISSGGVTLFGNFSSAPAVFSFGYTTDSPPKINNVTELIAGTAVVFSPAATGTFTITGGTTGGGGGTPTVSVKVTGPGGVTSDTNTFQTFSSNLTLDASQSTSKNAGALTYLWVPAPGYPTVGIIGGTTATPTFTLIARAVYQFNLTVTDSTGVTGTATVTVQYH